MCNNSGHKVSVIIPIYNTGKYLAKCLDSITKQTYKNLEIICVNDGSTDNSQKIIEEYASKDSRINIIVQENRGVSFARNRGLDKATGDFITFVDSDDWVETECYELAINIFLKDPSIDLVQWAAEVCNRRNAPESEYNNIRNFHKPKFVGKNLLTPTIVSRMLYSPCCNLFKTSIIKSLNLRYRNYKVAEDVLFITMYISRVNSIYFIDKKLYNYNLSTSSAMKRYTDMPNKLLEMHIKCALDCYDFYHRLSLDNLFNKLIFYKFKANIFWDLKFVKFDTEVKCLLKDSVSHLPQKFNWGNEVNYIRQNKFYKIEQLNIPQKTLGNDLVGFKLFNFNNPFVKVSLFGISFNVYYQKIFAAVNISEKYKLITFFGIKFKLKRHKKKINLLDSKSTIIDTTSDINQLRNFISNEVFLATIVQDVHKKAFSKFKNCYEGKDIVLVASGPTMRYYTPITDAIYIGVNKAYKNTFIKFDFLFAQDFGAVKLYLNELLSYPCIKFLGDYIFSEKSRIDSSIIPLCYRNYSNVYNYYSGFSRNLCYPDIQYFPLMDFGSVVFPAIHFALYTNPKKIYLVGCDCSADGYFDKSSQRYSSVHLIEKWKIIKHFINVYYPNVQIISVNPIGLKGMFKDIYTDNYIRYINQEENDESSSDSCI